MSNFNLNSLNGRIAEQLVQDLFQQSGYNVFNFGLERLHPGLSVYSGESEPPFRAK
ncbi:MAG: hypothetical protein JWP77_2547 [Polaromonas sp.]|nr:hypothetical protein [Polaromonas sp.]